MLSLDDVRRIAAEEGLAEHADTILRLVRPGWRLHPMVKAGIAPGASKIGGRPDLASDERWPLNHRGVRMTFLAQINFDELPAFDSPWAERLPALAPGGLVRVFADLYDAPYEPGPACALLTVRPTHLIATEPPEGATPQPSDDEPVLALPEVRLQAVPFLTAPERLPGQSDNDSFPNGPYAWANRLRVDGVNYNDEDDDGYPHDAPMPWELHHFLGEASSMHDDVRHYPASEFAEGTATALGYEPDPGLGDPEAWQTLLALHDDPEIGLSILDAGAYTVLVPSADLDAGRFDRTYCAVESG